MFVPHLLSSTMTDPFFHLSYYDVSTKLYNKGLADVCYVFMWVVSLTFLRASLIDWVFVPLARNGGVTSKKSLMRISEQAWMFTYFLVAWTVEMVLLVRSPYWLDTYHLWTDWPVQQLDATFKRYYLIQTAVWIQTLYTINIEARRKDHNQMFTHHIVTITLLVTSYIYHFTRVGHAIMCLMDLGDILLPVRCAFLHKLTLACQDVEVLQI